MGNKHDILEVCVFFVFVFLPRPWYNDPRLLLYKLLA